MNWQHAVRTSGADDFLLGIFASLSVKWFTAGKAEYTVPPTNFRKHPGTLRCYVTIVRKYPLFFHVHMLGCCTFMMHEIDSVGEINLNTFLCDPARKDVICPCSHFSGDNDASHGSVRCNLKTVFYELWEEKGEASQSLRTPQPSVDTKACPVVTLLKSMEEEEEVAEEEGGAAEAESVISGDSPPFILSTGK